MIREGIPSGCGCERLSASGDFCGVALLVEFLHEIGMAERFMIAQQGEQVVLQFAFH